MPPKKEKKVSQTPINENNPVELAFRKMLEDLREDLKKIEPIPILETNPRDVHVKDIKVKLSLYGINVSGLHEFIVNKVIAPTPLELKWGELWIKYVVTVPHLHIAGKYEVEGTYKKNEVRNISDFQGDILFYKNAGFVTFFEDDDEALQVETYKIKLSSLGINMNEKGLNLGPLGSAELKPLIDAKLHEYLKTMWTEWSAQASGKAKEKFNTLLRQYHKDRAHAALINHTLLEKEEQTREEREEAIRKCKEFIARQAAQRPSGYPLSRDQSLMGWMCPANSHGV